GRDFIFRIKKFNNEEKLKSYAVYGLIISAAVSIALAWAIPSVIEIWYTVGSFCIPGIILPVVSSYFVKIRISKMIMLIEMITAVSVSIAWYFLRTEIEGRVLYEVEPMIAGLFTASVIHCYGIISRYVNPKS
ncbi:MAG: hypothetical protein ACM34J_11750, partial [Ignavibacteria bacterium]